MKKQELKEWRHEAFLDFCKNVCWLSLICAVMSLLFAVSMSFLEGLKFFLITNGLFNIAIIVGGLLGCFTSKPNDSWEIGAH